MLLSHLRRCCMARSRARRWPRPWFCCPWGRGRARPRPRVRRARCWRGRRRAASAWWCTRWSDGGCVRSEYSGGRRSQIWITSPGNKIVNTSIYESHRQSLPAMCTLCPGPGTSQYHRAGRDHRISHWNQMPWLSELLLILSDLKRNLNWIFSVFTSISWNMGTSLLRIQTEASCIRCGQLWNWVDFWRPWRKVKTSGRKKGSVLKVLQKILNIINS